MGDRNKFHTVRGYEILTKNKTLLTPSMEDYLEMIYRIHQSSGHVRIKILADRLNVRDSSVTKMVQKIAAIGLLEYEKYGVITLTKDGIEVGEYLLHRHETVERFLKLISKEETLLMDIEMIEHSLSPNIIEDLCLLNNFFAENSDIKVMYEEFKRKNHCK